MSLIVSFYVTYSGTNVINSDTLHHTFHGPLHSQCVNSNLFF